MQKIRRYVRAHRKAIIAAVTAIVVLIADAETADKVAGAVGLGLLIVVPNDQDAIRAVYHKGRV